jgi:hypothetical protein
MCISFWRRSSSTLRCEFECLDTTKVGLAAGLYSGTSRPDLYLTPQALHRVFGPIGPVRHCGVLSVSQCRHLRPPDGGASANTGTSFFFSCLTGFFTRIGLAELESVGSEMLRLRTCDDFQLLGPEHLDRLLRALLGGGSRGAGWDVAAAKWWLLKEEDGEGMVVQVKVGSVFIAVDMVSVLITGFVDKVFDLRPEGEII